MVWKSINPHLDLHQRFNMRAVLFGLLATATIMSATEINCKDHNVEDLVSKTACGNPRAILKCLVAVVDLRQADHIQQCFAASGCDELGATVEATRFAQGCRGTEDTEVWDELKIRQDDDGDDGDDGDETTSVQKTKDGKTTAAKATEETSEDKPTSTAEAEKTTTSEPKTTKESGTTTAPSTAAATTTSADPTSTEPSTTVSTPSSTTSESTTTSTTASSVTTGSTTSSLVCSVTDMVTTSVCLVSNGMKVSCTPTITPSPSCAPGVICQTDDAGNDVCLKKDNHLTTSGLIVTSGFAISIIAAAIAIVASHYQSRAAGRRRERERLALLGPGAYESNDIGRAAPDVEAVQPYSRRNPSEAHVPLITPGGARSDQQSYQQQNSSDFFSAQGGADSVPPNESGRAAPKLHPGLGALGQN